MKGICEDRKSRIFDNVEKIGMTHGTYLLCLSKSKDPCSFVLDLFKKVDSSI